MARKVQTHTLARLGFTGRAIPDNQYPPYYGGGGLTPRIKGADCPKPLVFKGLCEGGKPPPPSWLVVWVVGQLWIVQFKWCDSMLSAVQCCTPFEIVDCNPDEQC